MSVVTALASFLRQLLPSPRHVFKVTGDEHEVCDVSGELREETVQYQRTEVILTDMPDITFLQEITLLPLYDPSPDLMTLWSVRLLLTRQR